MSTTTAASDVPLDKSSVDYSLYLITARGQIPAQLANSSDPLQAYLDHLDLILSSRVVTIVQLREKDLPDALQLDQDGFVDLARRSLAVCDKVKAFAFLA